MTVGRIDLKYLVLYSIRARESIALRYVKCSTIARVITQGIISPWEIRA